MLRVGARTDGEHRRLRLDAMLDGIFHLRVPDGEFLADSEFFGVHTEEGVRKGAFPRLTT